jgi:hypothetical protein
MTEEAVPFRASLPAEARGWLWLPLQTLTLTGVLPDGFARVLTVHRCPQRGLLAHNVAQVAGPEER